MARSRHLWLTARLVDFSLIPQEWQEYKAAGTKDTYLATFESFYQEAEARDTAMAQNLLSALNGKHSKTGSVTAPIAVLVTGGFHADGIARQLTRQGVAVISYVPKIEKVDTTQGSAYLSVFTQEKTPLEKLFQGEKLFLSPDTVTPTRTIAPPLVAGMDALTSERNESSIKKKEALLSFLKKTTGEDVQVEVSEVGRDLDDGSVNVSIRLGEKKTQIKIKTGPHFEILAVDGFSPAPPSLIAHWLMRGFARLHTWFGPAAHRVAKLTEAIPLSGLPFWSAANKAWWLTFHPTIKSVSDVVWQLAFLEAAATAMHQVQPKASSSFLNPIRTMLAQIRIHSRFNAISPIMATGTVKEEMHYIGKRAYQWQIFLTIEKKFDSTDVYERRGVAQSLLGLVTALNSNNNPSEFIKTRVVPLFEKALGDPDVDVRRAGSRALGLLLTSCGDQSYLKEFIEDLWKPLFNRALGDRDEDVALGAVYSLNTAARILGKRVKHLGDSNDVLSQLFEQVERDPRGSIKLTGSIGLAETVSERSEVLDQLEKELTPIYESGIVDPDAKIRNSVANTLGAYATALSEILESQSNAREIFERNCLSRFSMALASDDWVVRRGAANNLGVFAIAYAKVLSGQEGELIILENTMNALFEQAYQKETHWEVKISAANSLGGYATALLAGDSPEERKALERSWKPLVEKTLNRGQNGNIRIAGTKSLESLASAIAKRADREEIFKNIYRPMFMRSAVDGNLEVRIAGANSFKGLVVGMNRGTKDVSWLTEICAPLLDYALSCKTLGVTNVIANDIGLFTFTLGESLGSQPNAGEILEIYWSRFFSMALENADEDVKYGGGKSIGSFALSLSKMSANNDGSVNKLKSICLPLLEAGLKSENLKVRSGFASSIGYFSIALANVLGGQEGAPLEVHRVIRPIYEQVMMDPDPLVRKAAVEGFEPAITELGTRIGGGEVLESIWEPIYEIASIDPDGDVRRESANSLGMAAKVLCSDKGAFTEGVDSLWPLLKSHSIQQQDDFVFAATAVRCAKILLQSDKTRPQWREVIEIMRYLRNVPSLPLVCDGGLTRLCLESLMGGGERLDEGLILECYQSYFEVNTIPKRNTGPKDLLAHILFDFELHRQGLPNDYPKILRSIKRSPSYGELLPQVERLLDNSAPFAAAVKVFSEKAPSPTDSSSGQYWGAVREILRGIGRDWDAYRLLRQEKALHVFLQRFDASSPSADGFHSLSQFAQRQAAEIRAIIPSQVAGLFNLPIVEPNWINPTPKEVNVILYVARNEQFTKERHPLYQALRSYFQVRLSGGTVDEASAAFWEKTRQMNPVLPSDLLDESGTGLRGPPALRGLAFLREAQLRDQLFWNHWREMGKNINELQSKNPDKKGDLLYDVSRYHEIANTDQEKLLSDTSDWLETVGSPDQNSHVARARYHLEEIRKRRLESGSTPVIDIGGRRVFKEVDVSLEKNPLEQLHLGWSRLGGSCLDLMQGSYQEYAAGFPLSPWVDVIYVRDPSAPIRPLARIIVGVDLTNRTLFVMSPIKSSDVYDFVPLIGAYLQSWAEERNLAIVAPEKLGYGPGLGKNFVYGSQSAHLPGNRVPYYSDLTSIVGSGGWAGTIQGVVNTGSHRKPIKPNIRIVTYAQLVQEIDAESITRGVIEVNQTIGWANNNSTIVSRLTSYKKSVIAVDQDNKIYGYLLLKDDGYIPFMAVHNVLRGMSVGTQLFLTAAENAKEVGIEKVSVHFRANRSQAIFYDALSAYFESVEKRSAGEFSNGDPQMFMSFSLETLLQDKVHSVLLTLYTAEQGRENPNRNRNRPMSLLDSIFRAAVRVLLAEKIFGVARTLDNVRVWWNRLGASISEGAVFSMSFDLGQGVFGWVVALFAPAHAIVEFFFDILPRVVRKQLSLAEGMEILSRRMVARIWSGILFALPFLIQAVLGILGLTIPSFIDFPFLGGVFHVDMALLSSVVLHVWKNWRSGVQVKNEARADAVKAAGLMRGGKEMSMDDVRALLLPKIETPAIEQLSPGLAFSRQTAQRLREDFEYRHEFVQAYRKELTKADLPLPSFGDIFWSFHQVSTVGPTAAPAAKEDNAIQVIEEIISERDLDKAKALIDRFNRANGSGSAVPFKLRLIPADPVAKESLERMAQGNPDIVRSVELDAVRLEEDFNKWRMDSGLQNVPLRLVISVSEGVERALGTVSGNSFYSIALRVALFGSPVRPVDIENMLQIAEAVTENA
ncbi:MAG: GNAT family N-acetyltransferase [Elusimicrobia bacterium]|nr:GNAT family N-acetyltransferase [Elusimicrobiota bacterium]